MCCLVTKTISGKYEVIRQTTVNCQCHINGEILPAECVYKRRLLLEAAVRRFGNENSVFVCAWQPRKIKYKQKKTPGKLAKYCFGN